MHGYKYFVWDDLNENDDFKWGELFKSFGIERFKYLLQTSFFFLTSSFSFFFFSFFGRMRLKKQNILPNAERLKKITK